MTTIQQIKLLIKKIDKNFGHNCKTECWDCPVCKAMHLKAGLNWWLELEEFGEKCKKLKK